MSDSQKITVNVSCTNEYADGVPTKFALDIDGRLLKRVRELAGVVVKHGVCMIEEFNSSGDWTNESGGEFRLDVKRIEVERDIFRFTCIPKHGNTADMLFSDYFYIDTIEKELSGNHEVETVPQSVSQKTTLTVIAIDKENNEPSFTGVCEPLVYDVEVDDINDANKVAAAVARERAGDLGFDISPDSIVPQFAVPAGSTLVADWRTG